MPFIKTDELNIHYETAGSGKEVLLLLHGNFASWRWWLPVLKNTPRGYRAYAPDMRGCGDSDHPPKGYTIAQHAMDLHQFIQKLRLPRLHLVGHSLGGCVALEYALKFPNRIKSLTLVAPAPAEGRSVLKTAYGSSYVSSASALRGALRISERMGTTRRALQRVLSEMMCPDHIEADFEALVDDAVRMSQEAAVGHVQTLNKWDVRKDLGTLHLPVLIIGGQDDELIPPKNLQKAAKKLSNGRLIIWPRMGHAPQLESPQRFITILNKFTQQHKTVFARIIRYHLRRLLTVISDVCQHDYYLMYD